MRKISLGNLFLVLIFLFSFVLMIFAAKMDSITTDEGVHLFAGYTYLTQRNFRLDPEHPPFLKEMAALPTLFFKNLNIELGSLYDKAGNFYYDSWREARALGDYFVSQNSEKIIFWGRFPFIILTLILGAFAYFWAKKIYGDKAGIFAAFLVLFFPNILAHGHLINTDLGLTLFILVATYFWGQFLKKPVWQNLIPSGLFLGLAFSSKYTAVLILPALVILAIVKFILDTDKKTWSKYLIGFFVSIIISYFVILGSYSFKLQAPPVATIGISNEINQYDNHSFTTKFDNLYSKVRPIIIPADYFKGISLLSSHALGGQSAFLLGQNSNTGWWYYFPVAIFFKTPIPIFILPILAIVYFRKIKAKDIFDEYLLTIPPIVFLALAMYSKADLGIRHILPIFPFVFLFISKTINLIDFKKMKFQTIGFVILIAWYLASALISFPNYLAYFNEFAGGPNGGYKILADSNLDWGQDVFRIKDYMTQNDIQKPYMVYGWDGDSYLQKYSLDYVNLAPGDTNIKGDVVIGASALEGTDYNWLLKYPRTQITPGVFLVNVN